MKSNYWKYFIYACLIAGGTACHSGYDPVAEEIPAGEVAFRIRMEDGLFTKANGTGFEIGDSIGVYAVRRSDPGKVALPLKNGNQAHNAKLVKTDEGWEFATIADKIVYPQDGSKLDFFAYYPYDRQATDPESCLFKVKSEQDSEKGLKGSDFMVARNVSGMNSGEVQLIFSHALAMVRMKVSAGSVEPGKELKVQMSGVVTTVSYHFGNDLLTTGQETGTIILNRTEDAVEPGTYVYVGYVPTQTITAGVPVFRCIQGGKIYIYNSQGVELIRGNRTLFELTLENG